MIAASLILALLLFISFVWWLFGPAYYIRGGKYFCKEKKIWIDKSFNQQRADKCEFVHANGKPVIEYDGNNPENFPKWQPYTPDKGSAEAYGKLLREREHRA